MALNKIFVDGFLRLEQPISWVTVAREIFHILDIRRNETRYSDNISPLLGVYAIGYYEAGDIKLIPLFSNDMHPGLIITFKSIINADIMIDNLKLYYGNRFWLEEPEYEWPENGESAIAPFEDRDTILLDGVLKTRAS